MNKHFKRLAALISASLAYDTHGTVIPDSSQASNKNSKNSLDISVLNTSVSPQLAAHRSHSSHASHYSHASHRSSAGSSAAPSPSYTSPSSPSTSAQTPQETNKNLKLQQKLNDKAMRKNIIMRMQLTLQFQGYYNGKIDGVMGPETRAAVMAFKKAKGIPGDKVLDAQTLNAFGIMGY